jgi:hypothetical protein
VVAANSFARVRFAPKLKCTFTPNCLPRFPIQVPSAKYRDRSARRV